MSLITNEQMEQSIITYCDNLKVDMLTKWRAGRAEHNDDLNTLDVNSEIQQELLDIQLYRLIGDAQRNG